jgi:hypothetical protein
MFHLLLAALAGCLVSVGTAARAAYVFTDDFSGPSLDVNLVDIEGAYFFSGGKIGTSASRSYVRTVEDDYLSFDFQADLVYSIDGSGGAPGIFFGIGPATEDAGFFDEPEAAIYLLDHTDGFPAWPNSDVVIRVNGPGSGVITDLTNLAFPDGPCYARITKVGDSLTFEYDHGYDGVAFDPDGSYTTAVSAVAPFLSATQSHLFFGTGSSPSRFDSIQVQLVPEAASPISLASGLATVALLKCRRRPTLLPVERRAGWQRGRPRHACEAKAPDPHPAAPLPFRER